MPTITLTFTAAEAQRLQAALAPTPYPQTAAGLKELLADYLKDMVTDYERAKATKTALATVAPVTAPTIT